MLERVATEQKGRRELNDSERQTQVEYGAHDLLRNTRRLLFLPLNTGIDVHPDAARSLIVETRDGLHGELSSLVGVQSDSGISFFNDYIGAEFMRRGGRPRVSEFMSVYCAMDSGYSGTPPHTFIYFDKQTLTVATPHFATTIDHSTTSAFVYAARYAEARVRLNMNGTFMGVTSSSGSTSDAFGLDFQVMLGGTAMPGIIGYTASEESPDPIFYIHVGNVDTSKGSISLPDLTLAQATSEALRKIGNPPIGK